MKAMAVIGFILAGLSAIGGLILSTNGELPMQGFSAVLGGIAAAFLFALPSTALIGIAQLRDTLRPRSEKPSQGQKEWADRVTAGTQQ